MDNNHRAKIAAGVRAARAKKVAERAETAAQLAQEIERLYTQEKLNIEQVGQRLGCSTRMVSEVLHDLRYSHLMKVRRNNAKRPGRKAGHRTLSLEEIVRRTQPCAECKKVFERSEASDSKYCSILCRNKAAGRGNKGKPRPYMLGTQYAQGHLGYKPAKYSLGWQFPEHLDAFKGVWARHRYHHIEVDQVFSRTDKGFMAFVEYLGPVPDGMPSPSVGRIDHFRGYVRGNFRWESWDTNRKEALNRENERRKILMKLGEFFLWLYLCRK